MPHRVKTFLDDEREPPLGKQLVAHDAEQFRALLVDQKTRPFRSIMTSAAMSVVPVFRGNNLACGGLSTMQWPANSV